MFFSPDFYYLSTVIARAFLLLPEAITLNSTGIATPPKYKNGGSQ